MLGVVVADNRGSWCVFSTKVLYLEISLSPLAWVSC